MHSSPTTSVSSDESTHQDTAKSGVEQFEPLLDSQEAAKLLGNIHVKTLQRYARRGSVPSYRIGSHWYFRASDLDRWLRTQISSLCRQAVQR